jgi:hypothetical protein
MEGVEYIKYQQVLYFGWRCGGRGRLYVEAVKAVKGKVVG